MAEHPRPSPSPHPDVRPELDDEPKTDPGLSAALARHDNKLTVRSVLIAVSAVAIGTVTALIFIDNRVAAQTDAGVRVHESRITALEQAKANDRAENSTRFQRIEEGQLRTDKKLDALLDRLDVRNPAPTPKDGGP